MGVLGGAAAAALVAGCGGRIAGEPSSACAETGSASNGSCEPGATSPPDASLDAGPQDGGNGDASTAQDGLAASADASDSSADASGTEFTTFLANAAHTDSVEDSALVPPLRRLWTISVGQPVSYPLVVGNLVYVTTSANEAAPARILALDRATGASVWSSVLGTAQAGNLAYDQGRVFETDSEGMGGSPMFRAFDAITGARDWQVRSDPNEPFYGNPPVAYDGILYVTGEGSGGRLYGYDETSGALSWSASLYEESAGSPAVSSDGVLLLGGCGETTDFGLAGGTAWQDRGECTYAGTTPVLVDHTLYEILTQAGNQRVDTRTGEMLGTFTSDVPPAFGDGMEFDVVANVLRAVSMSSGATAWTFSANGGVTTSALVAGGTVYVGSSIGKVFAIDAKTG